MRARVMMILLITLVFLSGFDTGCSYTLRYKYPSPIPSKSFYELGDIQINIVRSEAEFQALVKQTFGEKDDECVAFTTYQNGKTIVYLRTNPDGSIELDFLGHELWYHFMEKEKGH